MAKELRQSSINLVQNNHAQESISLLLLRGSVWRVFRNLSPHAVLTRRSVWRKAQWPCLPQRKTSCCKVSPMTARSWSKWIWVECTSGRLESSYSNHNWSKDQVILLDNCNNVRQVALRATCNVLLCFFYWFWIKQISSHRLDFRRFLDLRPSRVRTTCSLSQVSGWWLSLYSLQPTTYDPVSHWTNHRTYLLDATSWVIHCPSLPFSKCSPCRFLPKYCVSSHCFAVSPTLGVG